jgi:hypothetical protein
MLRKLKFLQLTCLATFTLLPTQLAFGQEGTGPMRLLMGISVGTLRTSHPEGDGFAAGALVGLDHRIGPGVSLRTYATLARGIINADDTAICHQTPDGCLADAVFPKWQLGLGLEGSISPHPSWPFRVVTGLGVVRSSTPTPKRETAATELGSKFAGVWRFGLEIPFGSSPKAASLQLTRSGFTQSLYSVSGMDAITLSTRR